MESQRHLGNQLYWLLCKMTKHISFTWCSARVECQI